MMRVPIFILSAALFAVSPAFAQKKYDPGASDTEIRLGQTLPYSGPVSVLSGVGKSQTAYFRFLNETQGGINGRKVSLLSLDDGYSPPKTLELTRQLVERDNVLAIVNTVGTATNRATHRYLNQKKVPQLLILSGAAVALLAGKDALAAKGGQSTEQDIRILNTAIGAELEAIAAYQVGAESGLLQAPVLALAVTFQGHHREHADILSKTIVKLGGKPAVAKAKYNFPVEKLKTQADVLQFAASLEKGAVSAYLNAVPLFGNPDLAKAAASILGDEAMHWAILRNALGEVPVPSAFMS